MKIKKFISILLTSIMLLSTATMLSVSAEDVSVSVATDDEASVTEEKTKCTATLEDDFADDVVEVILKNEPSLVQRDYTVADFAEVEPESVKNSTKYATKHMREEFEAQKANYIEKKASTFALKGEKSSEAEDSNLVAKAEKFAKEKISEEYSNFNRVISITLKTKGKEKVLEAVKKLEKRDDVKAACPRMYGKACAVPNDPKYKAYWPDKIQLPQAWNVTTGSKNVKVGIIDSGIKGDHPDLVGNIDVTSSKSFVSDTDNPLVDKFGHGTPIAGIIGAVGNNSKGVAGVCWNVSLVSLKAATNNGEFKGSINEIFDYAQEKGIEILNLSWIFPATESLENAINSFNGLVICAAGNDGKNIDNLSTNYKSRYPSLYTSDKIISVAAIDGDYDLAYWQEYGDNNSSNYGKKSVDIGAPGVKITTTVSSSELYAHNEQYTSNATPFVTGVAALIKSKYPTISYKGIRSAILDNVDKEEYLADYIKTGGKLNANKAITGVPKHKYTIKYNKNGGTGTTMADTSVIFGIPTLLRKNTYTYAGKTFIGWYAKRASDNKWLYAKNGANAWYTEGNQPSGYTKSLYKDGAGVSHSSTVTGDTITMYAQWRENEYTIKFINSGSTQTMPDQVIKYGIYQNLRKNTFTKAGYTFAGWNAYRVSDKKWLYSNTTTNAGGWYVSGQQPSGYSLTLYADQASVGKTTAVDGDVAYFYAVWK